MTSPVAPHIIAEIRRATAAGEMRKHIAKRLGVDMKTVTRHTKDIEKPFDHRGKRNFRQGPKSVGIPGISHREDYEDF